ncbi:sodium:solute symporter [bacterium]|nr:MAG: sodium:solute symporter [bacterium]
MTSLDWTLVAAMYLTIVGAVVLTRGHMRGVTDYLAAGRSAGRYLLTISSGIAGLGAITVVANLEMGYAAGFAMSWWGLTMSLFGVIVTVSGWVNYRFRRTCALTLAEFLERRYSRRFRIYAGTVAFVAGLINFGIFPAVGARFFIHFLGLPETWSLAGLALPVFPSLMFVLLATAVSFVFAGGQVAVMITDFIQGAFANLVFLVLVVYLILKVGWGDVGEVMALAPAGHSKINPFDTGYVQDFNFKYFAIGVMGLFYGAMSWQGTQAYNSSARTAHEGKMGLVLGQWRGRTQDVFMTVVPILVFTVLHHPDWADFASAVQVDLDAVTNEAVRSQMRAPLVLARLLPVGLLGAFAALMLGAFISTHNTYLHSWSSIFIQDVVLPFRRTPLSPRTHLRLLRGGVVGVAVFIFVFSLFYRQSQAILLFFALTGAIFAGWSGAVVIGGLYTRWGTTAAAWTTGICGVTLTMTGFVLEQAQRSWRETGVAFWGLLDSLGPERTATWATWVNDSLPNGQELWGWAMWMSLVAYIGVSGVQQWRKRQLFDLDRLLHRGRWEIGGEVEQGTTKKISRGWKALGITAEFGRRDKALYIATWAWNLGWVAVFAFGTVYFLTREVSDGDWSRWNGDWLRFWESKFWIELAVGAVVIVWFVWGGVRDVQRLLRDLRQRPADEEDDGFVGDD